MPTVDELVALYGSVGWGAYTNDPDGAGLHAFVDIIGADLSSPESAEQ